jgi:Pyruvate/2-oxoacid:ferredoxin oxidoreductase gamma subunit
MIALGAFLKHINFLTIDDIKNIMNEVIPERLSHTIDLNMQALQHGNAIA